MRLRTASGCPTRSNTRQWRLIASALRATVGVWPPPLTERPVPAPDHHPIGISTGVFTASRGDWPTLVGAACKVSSFAVELSALSGDELPGLVRYLLRKPRLPFRYVSVHAPVKHQGLEESALVQQLAELPAWSDRSSRTRMGYPRLARSDPLERVLCSRTWTRGRTPAAPPTRSRPSSRSCLMPASASTLRTLGRSTRRWRWPTSCSTASALGSVTCTSAGSATDTVSPLRQTMNRCLRRYLIAAATFRGSSRRLRLRDGRRSCGRRRWWRLAGRPPATKRD
jgi:hypothetical protein